MIAFRVGDKIWALRENPVEFLKLCIVLINLISVHHKVHVLQILAASCYLHLQGSHCGMVLLPDTVPCVWHTLCSGMRRLVFTVTKMLGIHDQNVI